MILDISNQMIMRIFYVELILVMLIVICSYIAWGLSKTQQFSAEHKKNKLKNFILNELKNSHFNSSAILKQCKNIMSAYEAYEELNLSASADWKSCAQKFVNQVLTPLAKKKYNNRSWVSRYYSAKIFSISDIECESQILSLLKDRVKIVNFEAIRAGGVKATQKICDALINIIAGNRRKSYGLYFYLLPEISEEIPDFVYQRLQSENNPYVRSICYSLLLKYRSPLALRAVDADYQSDIVDLKIEAIKYMATFDKARFEQKIKDMVSSQYWQAKVVMLQQMRKLEMKDQSNIVKELLSDKVWWVRLNAALTLKAFGEVGIAILKAISSQDDKFAFEIAKYVLHEYSE